MSSKSNLFRVLCVFCLTLFLSAFVFADTIRLKNGEIIKGKIVSFDGGTFTVVIDDGFKQREFKFAANEISSIEFDAQKIPAASIDKPVQKPIIVNKGNTKIIKVGQNKSTDTGSKIKTIPENNSIKPITINVAVSADDTANGWTNSDWVVKKGQKIRITGSGRVSLGNGRYATPGGLSTLPDENKLIKDQPTGGLIAVIGDDNNEFMFVGDSIEFVAERDGHLFLGVNEGVLSDNSGTFDVKIEIDPTSGF